MIFIYKQLETMIKNKIAEQPSPIPCTITHIYTDGRVDITTAKYGELKYLESIVEHGIGDKTIIIFLENDFNQRMVI